MEELESLLEMGGLILVGLALAAITFVFQLARLAREKGDSEPLVSAIGYVIFGGIGGAIAAAVCTVILPIIGTIGGFIVGFALTLKLLYGKNISFWGLLFYPITFAIYAFVYFVSLGMITSSLEDGNFIALILGGVIFLGTIYFGVIIYFSEGEPSKPKRYKPEEMEKEFNIPKLKFIKKIKKSKPISKNSRGQLYSLNKEKKIILKITRNLNTLENTRKSILASLKPLKLMVTKEQINAIDWPHYDDKNMPTVAYYETEIVTSKGEIDIIGFPRNQVYIIIKPKSFQNLKNNIVKR